MSARTDSQRQTDLRRMTVLGLCLTFGLAVIVAQLVRWQIMMHPQLEQMAVAQRVREREIPVTRGYITDAHGRILAMNLYQWDISASPSLVTNPEEVAGQLAVLLNLPVDVLHAKLTEEAQWVSLARFVPQEIGEAIANLDSDGIQCEASSVRIYPMKDLAAHVLGFVNYMGDGFYGVDGYYNSALKGIPGLTRVEVDAVGDVIPLPPDELRAPKPGNDLTLTLDVNIQHIAFQELQWALEQYEAESGTIIIMDPKTGGILASVSLPTYDPNDYAAADSSLLADPAVSSMWEPGSVFKIMTWGAGLDSGVITPDMTVYDKGKMEVGGRVIENSDRKAHGTVTMTEALANSLNTVAAYISTTMGKDRFYGYLRRFGFGQLTDVDLASEGPGMMKLPGDANWFPSELGTNSFGQGIAVTPMQMITAVAAVANQGLLLQPHILQQTIIKDRDGEVEKVVQVPPEIVRQAISKEAAATLTTMLVEVVETKVPQARIPGYKIAGKTGTAEIPTAYGYHPTDTIVSFVGYAPAASPQFIILVKLDRPKTSRWAAYTAAPTFRTIAEKLFVYLHIPPDDMRPAP